MIIIIIIIDIHKLYQTQWWNTKKCFFIDMAVPSDKDISAKKYNEKNEI